MNPGCGLLAAWQSLLLSLCIIQRCCWTALVLSSAPVKDDVLLLCLAELAQV